MSNLNPEVEAQKTVASFREAAEKHTTIAKVWDEMAKDSKDFGHNSAKDKAYFHAVTEGLRKEGLLPEITVAYAKWHRPEMPNDNGDLGKHHIDNWERTRKAENGRVCEVEKALIDNLKSSYDSLKTTAQRENFDFFGHDGLNDKDLDKLSEKFAKTRHGNEARAQQESQVTITAQQMKHELFDPRKDDGTVLFDKLSRENGGKYITLDSMKNAVDYDLQNRHNQFKKEGWHSYLNREDHQAIYTLQQTFDDIAPIVGGGRYQRHADKITREDLDRYLSAHGGK
ncbi:MAG: hypothetical protein JST89_19420 [Cyanobacteria bacterium SZAS-4]|nr:hypothetical protein [Cyanobacteria bacterium SZAS-4]